MTIRDTPFLDHDEAQELLERLQAKTKRERNRLARRRLSPRDLLNTLREVDMV